MQDSSWMTVLRALDAAGEHYLFLAIYGTLLTITAAGIWATFVKAGQRGWSCVVPGYNIIVFLRIVDKSFWWLLPCCVPVVNQAVLCWLVIRLAKKFGCGPAFALGLIFLPFLFFPWLGFGRASYQTSTAAGKTIAWPPPRDPVSRAA